MNILKSAVNFFVGSPKTIDDVFDKDTGHLAKIGKFIGNQQFTDQELADYNATQVKALQKFVVDTLSENTDRSKARREIAVFVIKFYCLILFISGMTWPIDKEWSAMWFSIATSPGLALLVSGVAAFFFGVHLQRARASK